MNLERPVTAAQCAVELMETVHPIMQFIRTDMRNQRGPLLSVPQFRVLAFLNHYPGASLSDVAEHLGVTKATASTMVDRLVKRNLIDRADDPQERRQIVLKLTELGDQEFRQMQQMTCNHIAELLTPLTTEEAMNVSEGLRILKKVFSTADSGSIN